jgi:hypothetical protein
VLWGLVGFVVAVPATLVSSGLLGAHLAPLALVGGAAFGVLAGVLCRDWRLTREVERRHHRMLAEFPSVLAEVGALGKYWHSRQLVFSYMPALPGLWGSQKNT